jgi:cyclophilin family peptidyl-prolyl cis-trans isomerase
VIVESLEERTLLAATPVRVTQVFADNRGQTEIFFSQAIAPATLTKKSVRVLTAGADGQFGTADDTNVARTVGYKKGRMVINANLAANARYRVRLGGIKGTNGLVLDGEFNGMGKWSGNGVAGGLFDVTTQAANKPRARFTTSQGYINIGLFSKPTPNTLANFKSYADEKAWDGSFFHRSVVKAQQGFGVIQGGGFNVKNGMIDVVTQKTGIATEPAQDNLKGTIAMANTGQPNSNSNQWFFNVTDNPVLDNRYSVFGKVLDGASQKVIENINKLPIVDARGNPPDQNNPFGELPIRVQHQTIQVPADLVMITRVAMMMDVAATPPLPPVVRAAAVAPASVPASDGAELTGGDSQVTIAAAPTTFSTTAVADNSDLFRDRDPDLL